MLHANLRGPQSTKDGAIISGYTHDTGSYDVSKLPNGMPDLKSDVDGFIDHLSRMISDRPEKFVISWLSIQPMT